MQFIRLLPTIALGAVLTGCGGAGAAVPAVTVTTPQPAPLAEEAGDGPAKTGRPAAERKSLPDVVGMNLQEGQDTMQAAGFYALDDQDSTGQGRLQIYDRNWVITKQDPAAGRKVATDTPVTLYAKKYGE
ncbi:PASTA domain-containing protein [Streptosporangium minutum]|uniref:PASTA domain-containing protein n=1 Tax=Streptosporangium minutum TaxID=569862 RepID=UPI001A999ABF|nr:PASTA domain-containing protein [Streptosporangium minutum]